jgi:iron complex outermembrane receptor protein
MKRLNGTARRVGCGCFFLFVFAKASAVQPPADFLTLTFEELLHIKISSVAKREQVLQDAAASIYVITQDAIRNSGATTLPEALRLDPRLHVSRITATQYAIGIRGFTTDTNNKLLVLIDGRTIYTPLFSGVFWDHQDLVLGDVERIEVISGPGATLWGTNAVNGVINIITRDSSATTGLHASAHGGNAERGAQARYGAPIGDHGHFRMYGKYIEFDTNNRTTGVSADDGAQRGQVGFRTDWHWERDQLTVMGDVYHGTGDDRGVYSNPALGGDRYLGDIEVSGNNLLARWQRNFDDGSDFRLQAYWDQFQRKEAILFQPAADTWDIELQHTLPLARHRLLWGGGYRYSADQVNPGLGLYFIPSNRSLEWSNLFAMGEINLTDALDATLGVRLEHNSFTGMEHLPTARLAWKHSPYNLSWISLSRAVRAPSRFDRHAHYGIGPNGPWFVQGGPNFVSEVANVLELGHRGEVRKKLSYSFATYYHDWDRLRSATAIPVEFVNEIEGKVYGFELWADLQIMPRWQLSLGGTRLYQDLQLKPRSQDPVGVDNDTLSNDPDYYGQIRSTVKITDKQVLQISARYMGELTNQGVPSYTSIGAHYSYQLHPALRLTATAENISDRVHYEYGNDESIAVTFGRSAWVRLIWTP